MNRTVYFLIVTLLTFMSNAASGQDKSMNAFTGTLIETGTDKPVEDGYVSIMQGDSLVWFGATDKNGHFSVDGLAKGEYTVSISALFFKDMSARLVVGDTMRNVVYELTRAEKNIQLNNVTVTADRSQIVTRTANGQKFFLSDKARRLSNTFEALQEIPLLISDPAMSKVTMLNGKSPLVLIDGNRINSGISPINPSDIESVEVINVVPARYLQEGISGIVNIKLKKKKAPYVWLEAATRHDVPLDKGMGVFYFEVGNPKYSLYGRAAYNYTYHDDIESDIFRHNTTYTQNFSEKTRTNGSSVLGELLFKWSPTSKDYFAANAYVSTSDTKTDGSGEGSFSSGEDMAYAFTSRDRNESVIATTSLYYKHSFAESNNLEVRIAYNFNSNDYSTERTDVYGQDVSASDLIYNSRRNSGMLMIDYARDYDNGNSLTLGSHTSLLHDNIENNPYPVFLHNELNQYLYGGFGGKIKSVYYMLSAGVEGIWLKAAGKTNHYFKPRGSVSATWMINRNNSLQLSYTLSNTAPSVSNLNPYNISADSLVVECGNPYLKPQTMNYIGISYTYSRGNLYLTPGAYYKRITDMIEQYGFTDNGIYTNTYENMGHFSQAQTGLDVSYRLPWGRVYGGGGWYANYFMGQSPRHMVYANFGFNLRFNKVSFYGDLNYNNRDFSVNSYTQYYRPSYAQVQVNYNFTPDFYIALALQHFTGELRTKTVMDDGSYHSVTNTRYKECCLRPWILIRYTFRKNQKRKIKLEKVLNSYEKGISIEREK